MIRKLYKLLNIILCVVLVSILSACDKDEPQLTQQGEFRMPLDDGYILMEGNDRILSLTAQYPMLEVSSIFSLTTKAPDIVYVGQFSDLVEIPAVTSDTFSKQAVIHNQGGYLVRIGLIKSGTTKSEECIIKFLIKEGPFYNDSEPTYLDIQYQIYHTGKTY